jgi:microsomal dipeptidase-like Zn-dependent dipeptidase
MLFSVESSNMFDSKDWKVEFQKYWDAGARTLQIVHQFDNELAGAAMHKKPLEFAQYLRNWMKYDKFQGFDYEEVEYKSEFGTRYVQRNKKGLTIKGEEFIEHMIDLGMPLDFAHMSFKTQKDVLKITASRNYPFYISHGHFRDAQKGGLGKFEKSTPVEMLKEMKKVDGIFGVRTIASPTHLVDKNIQNNCDGSSLSFAHVLKFGQDLGVNIAFGSDFNGFIPQTRPRFSDVDKDYCKDQKVGRTETSFDTVGLGRVDQLTDLMKDLANLGTNTNGIEKSAEKFIQIWERSYAHRKQE